ncbi:hypothetical protein EIP91_003756 [Steccherinum ochraceum]|uniref:F-box domain-containing protein n=1 Tax=Steccherinum ochraceum TaxID=92696 RepID=A0A4R0RDD3_9APHY|nr:hypothetical protein EIP91_003756 [Steccherinum ochraceum]
MEAPSMNIEDLFKAVQLLPAIRCLKFYHVAITGPFKITEDLVPVIPKLKIVFSSLKTGSDILDALLRRLSPSELHLQHAAIGLSDGSSSSFRPEAFKSVRSLHIGGVYTNEASQTEWTSPDMLSMCPADTLTTFGLGYDIDEHQLGEELRQFLAKKGRHIECLKIDYGHGAQVEPEAEAMHLVVDDVGRDGFGGMPPKWLTVKLSTTCPSLKHLSLFLFVDAEPLDKSKQSSAIFLWRYALRLIASAPKALVSVTVLYELARDVSYEDLDMSTICVVNWKQWD